jgi:hypothetical protein
MSLPKTMQTPCCLNILSPAIHEEPMNSIYKKHCTMRHVQTLKASFIRIPLRLKDSKIIMKFFWSIFKTSRKSFSAPLPSKDKATTSPAKNSQRIQKGTWQDRKKKIAFQNLTTRILLNGSLQSKIL